MKGLAGVALLAILAIGVGRADASASYVHIEGVWVGESVSSDRIDSTNVSPFEAFLGETNYYFVLRSPRPTDRAGETRDYVGTCDGADYFWTCYRFPLEDGNKPIKWTNPKEAMGSGEVGIGSFPSNAPPLLQTLWLALVWHPQTNEQHPFGSNFVLSRMVAENHADQAKEFTASFSSNETAAVSTMRIYSPGTKGDTNYPDGWLYNALSVLESSNFAGRDIPMKFVYYDYTKQRTPVLESSQGAAKSDNVRPYWASAFVVTNLSLVPNQPSAFPPDFKGKPILIRDHRPIKGDILYPIDKALPIRGKFVSRGDPEYQRLLRGFSEAAAPRTSPRTRVFLIGVFITIALLPIFLVFRTASKKG